MGEGANPTLVVVVTLVVVLIINYGIVKIYTGKTKRRSSFISKTLNSAKNPWKRENDQLDELAKLVEKVSAKPSGEINHGETDQEEE